jgi:hypothetical protein
MAVMPLNADRNERNRRAVDAWTKSTRRTSHRPPEGSTRGRGPRDGNGSPCGPAYRTAGEPPPFLIPDLAERSSNGLPVRPDGGDLSSPRTVHLLDRATGQDRRRLRRVPAAAPGHHLPFATLIYALLYTPGIGLTGWEWFWVVIAGLFDIAHWAAGASQRNQLPGRRSAV